MTHSAEFNRRRRESYAAAVALGLTPREAGHFNDWSPNDPRFITRAQEWLRQQVPARTETLPSPAQRTQANEERITRGEPHSPSSYAYHSYYGCYVYAVIKGKDVDGNIRDYPLTITFAAAVPPTRAQLLSRIERLFRAQPRKYPVEILAIRYRTVQLVPDRTERPLSVFEPRS